MTKPKVSKTDYSKIADYYDRVRPAPADLWLSKIVEYGKINKNCTVLDVGCGTGRFPLGILAREKCLVCALEPSIEMLKQALAKDKTKNVLWVRGDGQKLPFKSDSFNCVYMTLVIHHIENKERALEEIYRTVEKNGNCVIMTTSHHRIRRHDLLSNFPGLAAIDLKRFPSVPSLKRTMKNIGFKNVHYHIVQHSEDIPRDEYLERVRKKYISTLTLLSEKEFQKGFKIFQERLRIKYGAQIKRILGFDFVVGTK